MNPTTTSATAKGKTKAKQRYLKQKRERRKNRAKPHLNDTTVDEARKGLEVEIIDEGQENVAISQLDLDVESESIATDHRRKRRKIVEDAAGFTTENPISFKEVQADSLDVRSVKVVSSAQENLPALPSFPAPKLLDAPSKSALALQGLDKALMDAEFVNPTKVLPIMPAEDGDNPTRLSEKTRIRLAELGIQELFAVQTALLPFLLPVEAQSRGLYLPYHPPRDVCISAPTGSGKTLAYVLPIIEILSSRIVTRLRALIVLPTRDLVSQVRETFEALGKGRGLKFGSATGQHSFAHEQSQLVPDKSPNLKGGSSSVDVLICTPGRLIDHINGTPNFSLQHLRFLVIDEADRLLTQSFQDWLPQVLNAIQPTPSHSDNPNIGAWTSPLPYPDAVAPTFLSLLPIPNIPTFFTEMRYPSCQKLLFSATLTRDPGKIAALELRNPKYFIIQSSADQPGGAIQDLAVERFSMPTTLKEHMVVCAANMKPLILFHLVHTFGVTNALVFTKSAESATRLVRLFEFFEQARKINGKAQTVVVHEYSSDLPINERKLILEKFKDQEIQILVCSDLISRGLDISHVLHVVSYDAPVDMRKYVHRVGRTARAGRDGDAWTLVEEQEAHHLKTMLKEADHLHMVKRLRVNEKDLAPLLPYYETSLNNLKDAYAR